MIDTSKVLITGVSGFLGRALAAHVSTLGASVIGVSRTPPDTDTKGNIRWHSIDLADFTSTRAILAAERPDIVFHMAATSVLQAAGSSDSGIGGVFSMLEANVRATWNILEAARLAGVGSVVCASSDKQYGAVAEPPYDDSDGTAFLNGGVYELSKAQGDQVARVYAGMYDSPHIRVARLANIYGPGDKQWTRIVPGTVRRTFLGEAPTLRAGRAGESLREYVFVDDALAALVALANDAAATGNLPHRREDGKLARVAVNIGSGHLHAAASVIETIQRVMHDEHGIDAPPPIVQPGTPGVFEPGSQFNRLDRVRELIPGYAPRTLEQGIRETVPWYLEVLRSGRRG